MTNQVINQCLENFMHKLNELFSIERLGTFTSLRGFEVKIDEMGMYLTQSMEIEELLCKTTFVYLKPCPTHAANENQSPKSMESQCKILKPIEL